MFDLVHRLLTGADQPDRAAKDNDPAFALAVLLIEVARSDDRFAREEKSVIAQALTRRFGLSGDEVARLVRAAEQRALQSADLYHFTRAVIENFTETERIGVIEMLWEVAYTDGVLTGDEDALIRRVAGLIYVPDRARGEARQRMLSRLGKTP